MHLSVKREGVSFSAILQSLVLLERLQSTKPNTVERAERKLVLKAYQESIRQLLEQSSN